MLIVKVKNGLGNQLFSYALGLYLLKKNPLQTVKYDFSDIPYYIGDRYTIKFTDFVDSAKELEPCDVRKYLGKKWFYKRLKKDTSILYKVFIRLNGIAKLQNDCILIKEPVEYWNIKQDFIEKVTNLKIDDNKTYVFDGVWENIEYILPVRKELINTINLGKDDINCELLKNIKEKNTVSVHIRRGDYVCESLQEEYPKNYYMICNKSYYDLAFSIIKKSVNDPLFVFFSDDPDFIEKEFKNIPNKIVVRGNRDYIDLYLMTQCSHHILANSTFSFWGAFLDIKDGIRIVPKTHYIRMNSQYNQVHHDFFKVPGWNYIDADE